MLEITEQTSSVVKAQPRGDDGHVLKGIDSLESKVALGCFAAPTKDCSRTSE